MVVEADVVAGEVSRQIGGSSGRSTRANTGASWLLQSTKIDFILSPRHSEP
jgi:hypothetical protein